MCTDQTLFVLVPLVTLVPLPGSPGNSLPAHPWASTSTDQDADHDCRICRHAPWSKYVKIGPEIRHGFRSSDEETQDASRFGRSFEIPGFLDHIISWDMWVYHGLSRTGPPIHGHVKWGFRPPDFGVRGHWVPCWILLFDNSICTRVACCISHDNVMWLVVSTCFNFAESCVSSRSKFFSLTRKGSPSALNELKVVNHSKP